MENYTNFLILFSFGCMVVTGGVIVMNIMVCRELDALKPEAKENKERAKFYSDYSDRRAAEVERLELENARLAGDLFTMRNYVQRLRVKAGEITPDGRLVPRNHRVWVQP